MKQYYIFSKERPSLYLLLLPCLFLLVTFLVIYPSDLSSPFLVSTCGKNAAPGPNRAKSDFRMLIDCGATTSPTTCLYSELTLAKQYDYVDIRFVICNATNEEHLTLLALVIMAYNDIFILNCTKPFTLERATVTSLAYLISLVTIDHIYDYAMKTDDDTYLRLDALVASLRDKPRDDMYCGLEIQCKYAMAPSSIFGFLHHS